MGGDSHTRELKEAKFLQDSQKFLLGDGGIGRTGIEKSKVTVLQEKEP